MGAVSSLKRVLARPSTFDATIDNPFLHLDASGMLRELRVEERGEENGNQELPRAEAHSLDSVEHEIASRVRQVWQEAASDADRWFVAIDQRISNLSLLTQLPTIESSAIQTVSNIRAEVAQATLRLTTVRDAVTQSYAVGGTEQSLRRAALEALEEVGAELVIIDESNHGARKSGYRGAVTTSVKLLLDTGVVPVALLGTKEAEPIFAKDLELSGRLVAPCRMGPLVWLDDYDKEVWRGLLRALDDRMVADGIIDMKMGLAAEKLDRALLTACNGLIGQLMGMMRTAARTMARAQHTSITFEDLVAATDSWNVGHRFITENPLRALK